MAKSFCCNLPFHKNKSFTPLSLRSSSILLFKYLRFILSSEQKKTDFKPESEGEGEFLLYSQVSLDLKDKDIPFLVACKRLYETLGIGSVCRSAYPPESEAPPTFRVIMIE